MLGRSATVIAQGRGYAKEFWDRTRFCCRGSAVCLLGSLHHQFSGSALPDDSGVRVDVAAGHRNSTGVGTLYVVAEMQSGTSPNYTFYHFLHALDITTLNEGIHNENYSAPVQICANGCGGYSTASDFSNVHIQRPGLLYVPKSLGNGHLADDSVYIAFSMMGGAATTSTVVSPMETIWTSAREVSC
jgi:hypothetical protein